MFFNEQTKLTNIQPINITNQLNSNQHCKPSSVSTCFLPTFPLDSMCMALINVYGNSWAVRVTTILVLRLVMQRNQITEAPWRSCKPPRPNLKQLKFSYLLISLMSSLCLLYVFSMSSLLRFCSALAVLSSVPISLSSQFPSAFQQPHTRSGLTTVTLSNFQNLGNVATFHQFLLAWHHVDFKLFPSNCWVKRWIWNSALLTLITRLCSNKIKHQNQTWTIPKCSYAPCVTRLHNAPT